MTPQSIVFGLVFLVVCAAPRAIEIEKIQLPEMGDSAGTLISPIQEKQLGESFFRNLHSQADICQDVEIQQYIQSIGRQLAANSDTPRRAASRSK